MGLPPSGCHAERRNFTVEPHAEAPALAAPPPALLAPLAPLAPCGGDVSRARPAQATTPKHPSAQVTSAKRVRCPMLFALAHDALIDTGRLVRRDVQKSGGLTASGRFVEAIFLNARRWRTRCVNTDGTNPATE